MLSSERYRKRQNLYRQRSRIAPLVNEATPHNIPIEQLPFPENMQFLSYDVVHTPPLFPPITAGEYISPANGTFHLVPPGERQISPMSAAPLVPPGERMGSYPQQLLVEQKTEKTVTPARPNAIVPSPLIIPGKRTKKSLAVGSPLRGRRLVVHGALSFLLLFIALGVTMALVPVDNSGHMNSSLPFNFHITSVRTNDTALITAQVATATAVTIDGYDPGGGRVYAGVKAAPLDAHIPAADYGRLSQFFYGQCTYWANMRYHQATGHWIPWLGNAYQWAYQAPAYGWTISDTPNPQGKSIIVFGPYAQGAGAYGHVAVVERVNGDGSVLTSNWNWNGAWATLSWRTFYPGRGISFIWYPD
ncbi:CHAP domain-containing protein [Dictyobacter kobayashii]|uniref:Peptidase C51 domain-containing protein n=1 Tax=Dictyobacter kobayashii TaxID=2014872 RepID=A0A402AFE5_9CHLR|nr:CHAP domain-containing protein [Dictyobacter kobayashii]GCE17821.1 hypothetical protein KDK_16210 [Dictyobacter kobayashii]